MKAYVGDDSTVEKHGKGLLENTQGFSNTFYNYIHKTLQQYIYFNMFVIIPHKHFRNSNNTP